MRGRACAGCGKTTLLSILAGSVSSLSRSSRVVGSITLDGQPRRAWASRLVAYVPQFDFLLPTLTVAETLRYSAQLRLPAHATAREVQVWRWPVSWAVLGLASTRHTVLELGGCAGDPGTLPSFASHPGSPRRKHRWGQVWWASLGLACCSFGPNVGHASEFCFGNALLQHLVTGGLPAAWPLSLHACSACMFHTPSV